MILLTVWTVSSYFGGLPSLFVLLGVAVELIVEVPFALGLIAEWHQGRGRRG